MSGHLKESLPAHFGGNHNEKQKGIKEQNSGLYKTDTQSKEPSLKFNYDPELDKLQPSSSSNDDLSTLSKEHQKRMKILMVKDGKVVDMQSKTSGIPKKTKTPIT